METYFIIGRAETVDDDEFDDEPSQPRSRHRQKPKTRESRHTCYPTLEKAIEMATMRARDSECDFIVYQAVKLVEIQKAPVDVKDLTPTTEVQDG